jgi:hypothetical protein
VSATSADAAGLPPGRRARRLLWVLAIGAALAALVALRAPLCPFAAMTGHPCPGCGLTRATLALLHGDVREALHLHPLVFVVSPLVVYFVVGGAVAYVRGGTLGPMSHHPRLVSALGVALAVLIFGVWALRFAGWFGGPASVG